MLLTDEHLYFGAKDYREGEAVHRIAKTEAPTPERIVAGFPVTMVVHDRALFVDGVVPAGFGGPLEGTPGGIVRAPLDGGDAEAIAETTVRTEPGTVAEWRAAGLAASDCYVYFILPCDDEPTYRLVAVSYGADTTAP
jgi:hypothetical protein